MPPERKIEKLLRAYAKKRRATGDDSFTLSPAARKRLQEEVARRVRGEETEAETSLTIWEFFRRQWAFLAVFAVAIFLGAALIMPVFTGSKAKSRSEVTLAMKEKPALMTVTASAAKEPAAAPVALTTEDDLKKSTPKSAVGTSSVSGLADARDLGVTTNMVLYYAPPNADLPALGSAKYLETNTIAGTFALQDKISGAASFGGVDGGGGVSAGKVATVSDEREYKKAEVDLAKNEAQKPSGQLTTPPAAAPPALEFRAAKDSELSSSYQNVAPAAKTSTVLARFKVTQHGSGIQIVDNDGSVYSGSWQPRAAQNTVNQAQLNRINQTLDQNTTRAGAAAPAQSQTSAIVQTAAQTYSVQFSGDNRTLKQKVVFTGDLSVVMAAGAAGNAANNGPASNGNSQQTFGYANANGGVNENSQNLASNGFIQPSLWLSSYIVGKATIAGTNQLEINAISVAP